MLNNVMGIINLMGDNTEISDLTYNRNVAAIPFAGRYRLIDFTLSNMVNAGIYNIGIFIDEKYKSLQDHIGTGRYWDLDRKRQGLRLYQPYGSVASSYKQPTDLDNFKNNIEYFERATQEYIILTAGRMITNMDFNKLYDFHIESDADITLVCKSVSPSDFNKRHLGLFQAELDENKNVLSIGTTVGAVNNPTLFLEMSIMKRTTFYEILKESFEKGNVDSMREALMSKIGKLKINAYMNHDAVRCINSIENYFNTSMDMLDPKNFDDFFYGEGGRIYTKVKDEPSTFYSPDSNVKNSLIANGCFIEGEVENSILFRGVKVGKGAVIKNSVVMQDSQIHENTQISYCVLDKNVEIMKNKTLSGDKSMIVTVKKNKVVD